MEAATQVDPRRGDHCSGGNRRGARRRFQPGRLEGERSRPAKHPRRDRLEHRPLDVQIPVGAQPAAVAIDPDAIWVTNADDGTVSRVDRKTNSVVQTIRVGSGPAGISIGSGAVWVLNGLDGTISRIDPRTAQLVQTIPVGNGPTAITYGFGALWVANAADGTVSKIDGRKGELARTFDAVPGSSGMTTGFGSLWITSERTAEVSRIDPGRVSWSGRSQSVTGRVQLRPEPASCGWPTASTGRSAGSTRRRTV